jgi:hypothetical protein
MTYTIMDDPLISFCGDVLLLSCQSCVGKEMPISRIVVMVPNATVVLLD